MLQYYTKGITKKFLTADCHLIEIFNRQTSSAEFCLESFFYIFDELSCKFQRCMKDFGGEGLYQQPSSFLLDAPQKFHKS